MLERNRLWALPARSILFAMTLACMLAFGVTEVGVEQKRGAIGKALVADSPIEPHEHLRGKARLEEWPLDKIPADAVRDLEDIGQLIAMKRFYRDEIITRSKVMVSKTVQHR